MKKLLFSFIVMMMPLTASADAVEIGGIYYNLISKNNVAEVTSNPSYYSGSVDIPSTVSYGGVNYNVTTIGEGAFASCWNLTSVNIPTSVISIGKNAFSYCSRLTSVTIPNNVTSIPDYAFIDCTSLASITIPQNVTSIGVHAFTRTAQTSLNIPSKVTYIGEYAFCQCKKLASVTIPSSVTNIGHNAFVTCTALTSVVIPNNVKSINFNTFQGCSSLSSVTIPEGVTLISESAFSGCVSLSSITIPSSVKNIKSEAFANCINLADVYCKVEKISDGSWNSEGINTNADAFKNAYQESISLHVPESSIDAYKAVEPWKNFKKIVDLSTISPNNLQIITNPVEIDGIYYNLISKNNVAEVTSNPSYYSGSVDIPSTVSYGGVNYNVTTIGEGAFASCWNLTSVNIPTSVISIGKNAFSYCSRLTSVTIPNNVTSIPDYAFIDCTSLASITIPQNVTSIGVHAFTRTAQTSLNIPSKVTYIGEYAFCQCKKLASVTIPSSVTNIGHNAFVTCTALTSVVIPNNVKSINFNTFQGCSSLSSVTIPEGVTLISESAFSGCVSLSSITIPSSVKNIKSEAFANCINLADVYCKVEKISDGSWNSEGINTNADAFKDSYQESISLHVPAISIDAYKAKEPWRKFYEIVAIEGTIDPEPSKCATPEIKFINDTFTFSCATQGVEFVSVVTVCDAKKYYDAKIKLAQTYKVSVYATKNGYERSDIATKEIVITNNNTGDVNGDGVVDVADHVKLSDIIMKKEK